MKFFLLNYTLKFFFESKIMTWMGIPKKTCKVSKVFYHLSKLPSVTFLHSLAQSPCFSHMAFCRCYTRAPTPSLCMGSSISLVCSPTNLEPLLRQLADSFTFNADLTSWQEHCWPSSAKFSVPCKCVLMGSCLPLYIVLTTECFNILVDCWLSQSPRKWLVAGELGPCVPWLTMGSSRPSIVSKNRKHFINTDMNE